MHLAPNRGARGSTAAKTDRGFDVMLMRFGHWMRRNGQVICRIQWLVIVAYLLLVIAPALLPPPGKNAHFWTDLTLLAQFIFWGIWWPFVLLSMLLAGRLWCGVFCPEGTLTEFASRHGLQRAIPKWVRWNGWPFFAFIFTTIYGQLISVYQYPKATLVMLGGSTCIAVAVGFLYGKEKRVWCRYLCPVSGVFRLLSKLAPIAFKVDRQEWAAFQRSDSPGWRQKPFNCAPLVPVRVMQGSADCHMCGRCSGYRDAVTLARRSPNRETVELGAELGSTAGSMLLIYGLLGIAMGAFHWGISPWFVSLKQILAEWLVDRDVLWPLTDTMPWWVMTSYPGQSDVLSVLDAATIVGYILMTGGIAGSTIAASLWIAGCCLGSGTLRTFNHLSQSLIPMGACILFLGLSGLTVGILRADQIYLPWISPLRMGMIGAAGLWSLWLAWRIAGLYAGSQRRVAAVLSVLVAIATVILGIALQYWIW